MQLAAVNLDSMCVIWSIHLESLSGTFTRVCALACAQRSNLLTVAAVSRCSSDQMFAPTEVYRFKADHETIRSHNRDVYHLDAVLRLQGNQVQSISQTSTQLIIGTMYGLFYIVNEASNCVFCYSAIAGFAHMTIEHERLWRTRIFEQHRWRSHIGLFPHMPLIIDSRSFWSAECSGFQIEHVATWP